MTDLISKAKRKVRTLDGVKFFNAPIGTPITPELIAAAMAKHGKVKTQHMVERQKRNNVRDQRRKNYQHLADKRLEARENKKTRDAAKREQDKANREYAREQAREGKGVEQNAPSKPGEQVKTRVSRPGERNTVLTDKQMDLALTLGVQQGPLGRGEGEIISRVIGLLKNSGYREDRVLAAQLAESLKRRMNMR